MLLLFNKNAFRKYNCKYESMHITPLKKNSNTKNMRLQYCSIIYKYLMFLKSMSNSIL